MAEHIPRVVIWGDGSGSTFRATMDAIHDNIVDFDITGVITTSTEAGILDHVDHANQHYGMDIEPVVVDGQAGRRQPETSQDVVLAFLDRLGTKSLCLMGAMVIIGSNVIHELNGDVPEQDLPKTLEDARRLMVRHDDGNLYLPADFPHIEPQVERFGLMNTHPAPTTVTANTHGAGASERMLQLGSSESAVTFHAVGIGIDTGAIAAAHRFPIRVLKPDATTEDLKAEAEVVFRRAQKIEKSHLPIDLENHLIKREAFLHGDS